MHVLSTSNPSENQILRSNSRLVTDTDFADGTVETIITQLKKTLAHYGNGVGLSAVQIGHPLQIFVINCRPTASFPDMQPFSQVIINPTIKNLSPDTFDGREGCMSIADAQCVPTQRYQVRRSVSVTFDYTDEHGIRQSDTSLSGISAVVFQHEYDHLFGRLIDEVGLPGQVISQAEYIQRKNDGEKMVVS